VERREGRGVVVVVFWFRSSGFWVSLTAPFSSNLLPSEPEAEDTVMLSFVRVSPQIRPPRSPRLPSQRRVASLRRRLMVESFAVLEWVYRIRLSIVSFSSTRHIRGERASRNRSSWKEAGQENDHRAPLHPRHSFSTFRVVALSRAGCISFIRLMAALTTILTGSWACSLNRTSRRRVDSRQRQLFLGILSDQRVKKDRNQSTQILADHENEPSTAWLKGNPVFNREKPVSAFSFCLSMDLLPLSLNIHVSLSSST